MEWREIFSSSSQTVQVAGSCEHGNKLDVTHTLYLFLHSMYQPTNALSNIQIVKCNSWQVSNSFTFRHSVVPKR